MKYSTGKIHSYCATLNTNFLVLWIHHKIMILIFIMEIYDEKTFYYRIVKQLKYFYIDLTNILQEYKILKNKGNQCKNAKSMTIIQI